MRVAIVGTGFMGRTHAAGWAATPAALAGFVGKTSADALAMAREFGGRAYAGFEQMLADVDVVDICTPTPLHREMVLRAAAAGKHVICEKPLARTMADAQEMIAACRAAGVKLLVAHVVRFFPEYALARQKVVDGEIGQPGTIRLTRGTYQPRRIEDNWFLDTARSGGMMLDLMIHDFDYARWVAGEVATVYAQKVSSSHPGAGVDHGLAILTHRSGALSHVEGSWAYPPPLFRTRLEIGGSNGWLRYDSAETRALAVHLHRNTTDAPEVPIPGSPLLENPYASQLRSFYDHLAHDAATPVSAVDGLAALQIALAALESAESGQPVQLAPLPEVMA